MKYQYDFCLVCEHEHGAFSAIAKRPTADLDYRVGLPYCEAHKAPDGPQSGFGKEASPQDYTRRVAWESWAARSARADHCEAMAQAHDLARVAYEREYARKFGIAQ